MSYFDIDEILALEEHTNVTFETDCQRLGFLLQKNDTKLNIDKGEKLDIPLWVLSSIVSQGYVTHQLPSFLDENARKELVADSQEVDLRRFSPFFYKASLALFNMSQPVDRDMILAVLKQVLATRFPWLVDQSTFHNSEEAALNEIKTIKRMSCMELDLYKAAHESLKELYYWKANIPLSTLSTKKRKRVM